MKWTIFLLTLAVGLLLGSAGHGSGPAPIEALAGAPRIGAHILMAIGLFGSLALATYYSVRYVISGDPPTVVLIDQQTGQAVPDEPHQHVTATAHTSGTVE